MCKHTFYYILGNKKYPEIYILQNHYKISTCSICALTFADPALCKVSSYISQCLYGDTSDGIISAQQSQPRVHHIGRSKLSENILSGSDSDNF